MKRIGDFEVVRELGRGGMGVVYEAVERPLERKVALKLLHPDWAAREDVSARFADEARKIALLSHPSIVRVHRFGKFKGTYYLALEYVDGLALDNALTRARLPLEKALDVLTEAAGALAHAHAAGIIHRDIKPGNIFLRAGGGVVVGDFGIAKDLNPGALSLTNTGDIFGTPAYMSPEQAEGRAVTCATDVYSLGVVAYELVTGRVPFTADSAYSLLRKHVTEPPPPVASVAPGVPHPVARLLERMLAKDPARRPQSGAELCEALTALRAEVGGGARQVVDVAPEARSPTTNSALEEMEVTAACFKLEDFSREACQRLLPARVAFLLESWYRLVGRAVRDCGGVVDRYVGGKVTALFGYPERHADHARRALASAVAVEDALASFNRAHDLELRMNVGLACGPALVGQIEGDCAPTSAQGEVMGEMMALARAKGVGGAIRLNRAVYRRVGTTGDFRACAISGVAEAWVYLRRDNAPTVVASPERVAARSRSARKPTPRGPSKR